MQKQRSRIILVSLLSASVLTALVWMGALDTSDYADSDALYQSRAATGG